MDSMGAAIDSKVTIYGEFYATGSELMQLAHNNTHLTRSIQTRSHFSSHFNHNVFIQARQVSRIYSAKPLIV